MDDFTKLYLDYHHTFVYVNEGIKLEFSPDGKICNLKEKDFADNYPGFWFSLNQNGKFVRCGCHHNIQDKIQKFNKLPEEDVVFANQSVFSNPYSMSIMREFKQKFKKLKKKEEKVSFKN